MAAAHAQRRLWISQRIEVIGQRVTRQGRLQFVRQRAGRDRLDDEGQGSGLLHAA